MNHKQNKILLLEDNQALARSIKSTLKQKLLLQVDWSDCLERSTDLLDKNKYQLLIVDRVLPEGDGLEIVDYAHQYFTQTRILMLTQKNLVSDRLRAYREGADDYLAKPFDIEELVIKVKKILKVYKINDQSHLSFAEVHLYPESGRLVINGRTSLIRKKEAEILKLLIINQNIVLSKDKLIRMVWPEFDKQPRFNTVEVYIRRLRLALGPYGSCIQTKRGYGYFLDTGSKH